MQRSCLQCQSAFDVTDDDLAFLEKVSPVFGGKKELIPPPTLCPRCRRQRRMGFRNERNLYKRTSAMGKDTLAIYAPEFGMPVLTPDEWYGDGWDAMQYGADFDFGKPFFEQFFKLQRQVPRLTFLQFQNENSEYTNCTSNLKDCYLLFSADFCRDCHFGTWVQNSQSCIDDYYIHNCELTIDSVFCQKSYKCQACVYCSNCISSAFLFDCKGCTDCFMCVGLRQKRHHILNKPYSKEEYEKRMKEFPLTSHKNAQAAWAQFRELMAKAVHPALWTMGRIEQCTGDFIVDSQNCKDCFGMLESKDCLHVFGAVGLKDARDACYVNGEVGYEMLEAFPMPFQSAFTMNSYTGSNQLYCDQCMLDCNNCFGCIGLKKRSYCILNKQYTKEEYEVLVPKIIAHMRKTGEWGEFFPLAMSPFGYNETMAQDVEPLERKEAERRGLRWLDDAPDRAAVKSSVTLPDDTREASDDLIGKTLRCETCARGYKIIAQELRILREVGGPLPHQCPECRYDVRIRLRNAPHLYPRNCGKCQKAMQTTYAPDRPEIVYCENCYLAEVY